MDIGIVGLPMSGKTTVFNAVTRRSADMAAHAAVKGKPNMGAVKVPDDRLDPLAAIFSSRRIVHAEVTCVDMPPAPEGFGETRGISGEFLNYLQRADALLVVARAFEDPSVPHAANTKDPVRDAEAMLYEMAFADLEIIDRRIARLEAGLKGAKTAERDEIRRDTTLMTRLKAGLESGVSIGDQNLEQDDALAIEGYRFLTAKPVIIAANVGEEESPSDVAELQGRLSQSFDLPRLRATTLSGKLEMELAQMEPGDEAEWRDSMEAGESGLDRMIRLSYDVLDLVTFFTGNEKELRAWTISRDTFASKAAGKIHSDFERGFIRAEVVDYDSFTRCGSYAESRRHGVLRQEGKNYLVKDGDVVNFLINV